MGTSNTARSGLSVLYLVNTLNVGGTEKQMAHTALRLHERGSSVTVGCLQAGGPLQELLQQHGVPVVEFPKRKTLLSCNGLRQLLRLVLFLRHGQFKVIHAWDLWANLLGVPAGWLAGTPVVISSRRYLANLEWYTPRRDKLMRWIYRRSTVVTVNSASVRELVMKRYGLGSKKVRAIHNAVDLDRFGNGHPAKARLFPGISHDAKLIAVLANMYGRVKGHAHLIAAAKAICGKHPDAIFVLIGDGSERAALENQVRAAGLGKNVLFLGQRGDVADLLACCDMGVLPSEAEAMPNSLLEMMAAGLPIVATSVGGIPEIVEHNVHGLLVPPCDPAALSKAVLRLLDDQHLAQRLAHAGQNKVRTDFSFEHLITELHQLYHELPSRTRLSDQHATFRGQRAGAQFTQ